MSYIDDLTYRTILDGDDHSYPVRKTIKFVGSTITDDPRADATIVTNVEGALISNTLISVLGTSNNAGNYKITNLGTPTFSADAATKGYVDTGDATLSARIDEVDGYIADMIFDHGELTGLTDDDHLQYLPINGDRAMTGDLDIGGNDLTNFRTDGVDGYAITGGASLTDVFIFFPTVPADGYCIGTVGIRIVAWELSAKNVSGVAECTCTFRGDGSIISILGTPVWDRVSQGYPITFDCDVIDNDAEGLIVRVKPGANNIKCNVYCWMQPAVELID
jgi:hypothetical protein